VRHESFLAPDGSQIFPVPEKAFYGFLISATIGGFIICGIYVLLCIGGLRRLARRPVDIVAAIVGLVIAGLGVAAQFVEGTAPVDDAEWGIYIALGALAVIAVWALTRTKTAVGRVAQHTLHHPHETREGMF
jgi:peptidoglycan/LPS O-acetylase OafA/YrhL